MCGKLKDGIEVFHENRFNGCSQFQQISLERGGKNGNFGSEKSFQFIKLRRWWGMG